MIEFASNATIFAFIELFAFMTNYDFESRMSYDSSNSNEVISKERLSIRERVLTKKAIIITEKMKNIWDFIKKKLINAQNMQKKHADRHRTLSFIYKIEDMIWLFVKNIKIERSFRKLNHKWINSFKIKKVLKDACQLDLSSSMKIYDTFHISFLRSAFNDFLIEQLQFSSLSIVIDEQNEKKYEIDDILNSRYHYEKLQYKVVWIDYFSDRTWYSTENFEHFKNILKNYHQRYSEKFESELRLIVIIEVMLSQWIRNEHKKIKQLISKRSE